MRHLARHWPLLFASILLLCPPVAAQEESSASGGPSEESPPLPEPDAQEPDIEETDTGETDTGETDTGETDTGETDTGETDTGTPGTEETDPENPRAEETGTSGEPDPGEDSAARVTPSGGKVVVARIDGEITLSQSAFVKRLLELAEAEEAEVLLIELNTFGGRADAAVAIRDTLLDTSITSVVFIHRRAISAGALISLASNKIAISPGATIGAATPVSQVPGQQTAQPVEEKYVSYFREEMRVTAETRGRNGDIAVAMVDADKEIPGISEKGKLLTLNTRTALEHKIADVEAESVEDALSKLGLLGPIVTVEPTWSEDLVSFLTSPAIASLLFFAMMFLAYLEYQTPGFGGFGFGALACFAILYFGHHMANLAGWEELLLFAIGVALILVEIFVIPGFGFAGVLGVLAVLSSLVMLLIAGDWSQFTFENPFTIDAFYRVALTIVVATIAMVLFIRWLPKSSTALGGRLVLSEDLETAAGFDSHEEKEDALVGRGGETLTPLRPAGKARIDGRRLNVETEGDFIAAGESVRVLRNEPGRIVVRRA